MLRNIKLTLLENEQIEGEDKLKVFDLIGTNAVVTDYAILCGACWNEWSYRFSKEEQLESRYDSYWTKSLCNKSTSKVALGMRLCINSYNFAISSDELGYSYLPFRSSSCVRPVLSFSEIKDFCSDVIIGKNGEHKYICGEFPQQVASVESEKELKQKLQNGELKEVDDITPDKEDNSEIGLQRRNQKAYEDEATGKRYILVKINPCIDSKDKICILSNGKIYNKGEKVFVEKQPLYWIKDSATDVVFSEKLITMAPFNQGTYVLDFESTDIYRYMNTDLVREIFGSCQKNSNSSSHEGAIKQLKKINPDNRKRK